MRNKQTYSRFIQNVLSWNEFPKGRMIQFLHHCVEHGITAFDNADFTGRNYIGKLFGVALSESGLSRDEIQLISKYGAAENEGDKLIETVDNLLLDLETDYLDLLLLDYPHLTPSSSDAVERLMSQGKVMEVGGLNLEEPHVRDFAMPLTVNQVPTPFGTRHSLAQIPTLTDAVEEIIHFVWCSSQNDLSEGERNVFWELGSKYDIPQDELYLRWLLQHPAHLHPVICSSEKEEIAASVACREKPLDPMDWKKIELILS